MSPECRETYQDSQFRTLSIGNITADPRRADHLAVVWSDMRNNPYPGGVLPSLDPYQVRTNSDIVVSQSFDGGGHWSAATAIPTDNDQFQPFGAYDASGRLQIGYYDRSYDPANHLSDTTLIQSSNNGRSWSNVKRVSEFQSNFDDSFFGCGCFIGDYNGNTIDQYGVSHPVWTGVNPGQTETDIFSAAVAP